RISNASRALITLALNNKFTVIVLPAKLLNAGKTIITIINASTNENKQKKKDSLKNFLMSNDCPAPNTFCIPVSLARFNAAAVERLIKLKQAINKINPAIINNV